ncbi:hypothetical protein [Amycolatopsis sp. RTGN1]|uniref:hypothetical protein n=1 Tax=Amycolatopsis ponsaeliensis TaxID=2992142 RepID=UPI00254A4D81|nr:hypothetical protein [Amycolatopsis sp. RTGN1]
MLVAFQRTGEERRLPAAAAHLVGLLRSWGPGPDHLTGLALTGITVPSRLGPRFVDALVFTRSGVVVIAAHSPGLSPGSAERAGAGVAAAKGALAAHDGGRYVTGLVAVVPGGVQEAVAEERDRLAEPVGLGAAGLGAAGLPGLEAVTVPAPREPVAESRSPEGDSAWREPDPGELDSDAVWRRPESARREQVPDDRAPDRAWGESDSGAREPVRAWDESDSGAREPDPVWRGPDPGEPASDRAWREQATAEPKADQPWGERDPGAPEPTPAWNEPPPADREPDQTWGHPDLPWLGTDSFPGVAVVLADPRGLRRIIGQHNRWRTVWTADDVLDACYALSLAHLAPPRAALLADGFPARLPALERVPVLPAVLPLPPDPPPPADDDHGPRIPRPRGHTTFPRQRPIRQVPWGLVFVLSLLVTIGVIAAVFVAQVFHGS